MKLRHYANGNMTHWAEATVARNGQTPAKHHRLLMTALESLSRGETDRLMVQMPPGSAKSTYASILFPAWWFTQHPRHSVIAACHTAGLATYFGRLSRVAIAAETATLGYKIISDDRASSHWSTSSGGEYYAVGTRGAIIGRRADLAIIDDPVKSQAEADSALHRDRLWSWYRSELTPRLKPGARIIIVMTRWHCDDICGRLLDQEPEQWQCLKLPALAEGSDPMERALGEALWPDWEDAEALSRRRGAVGERTWLAQFQQAPRPDTGSMFKADFVEAIDDYVSTREETTVRAWDLAATAATGDNAPDWTVGLKLTRTETGRYIIVHVVRLRGTPHEVAQVIATTARIDGRNVPIGLPEDPGQAGKSQIAYLTGQLAGYRVISSRETGAKTTRAMPVASQIEARNVAILRSAWNHNFIEELREFPYGRNDDQVDALSHAFNMTLEPKTNTRMLSIPHMDR